jgi:tetratricopeptide (TPR) repeat protein
MEKGEFDHAIADFDQALHIAPSSAAYLDRGVGYHMKGDDAKAIEDYTKSIGLNAKEPSTYNDRGFAYLAQGDDRKAFSDFQQAIGLDPQYAESYQGAAWILATSSDASLRDANQAMQDATTAGQLGQWRKPETLDVLAAADAEAGHYDDAIKWEGGYLQTPGLGSSAVSGAESRLALYQAHQPYHRESSVAQAQPATMKLSPAAVKAILESLRNYPEMESASKPLSAPTNSPPQN